MSDTAMSEKVQARSIPMLSEQAYGRLAEYIQSQYGIKMPPAKKSMLESRLHKRLKQLSMQDYDEYVEYLFSHEGLVSEALEMMNVVTTNKTHFFREPSHFEYLVNSLVPELSTDIDFSHRRPLKVWSAGCSSGEEPYTIGMVLSDYAQNAPGFDFSILATDLSSAVLDRGRLAIYDASRAEDVPMDMRKKYLLRSKDPARRQIRVVRSIRDKVQFAQLNLMDEEYGIRERMDLIFCRNVIIYFNRDTQQEIVLKLVRQLRPGGYLFMGHSETLFSMDVPLVQVAPTIYRKQ